MATAIEGPGGSQRDNGLPGEPTLAYYRERAANGVGMVIVEHTYIARRGKAHKGQLGLDNDDAIPAFKELALALRTNGAVAALQINHVGAVATPEVTGGEPLGPSDIPAPRSQRKPRAVTVEEICEVQEHFADAARRAQIAGFDAVEIHSAHGYLGTQFLSPLTNNRTDQYGGSLENRARFVLETVARVKERVGPSFPVFVRLGCTDGGLPGGFEPEDAATVARMLQDAGIALIDVSGGFGGSRPAEAPPGYFVANASVVKRNVDVPVLVTGGITHATLAEEILQEGHADLIGVGRAILQDSGWVIKAREAM
jgi:2,4-dienoyl-CoA reductase-like NADH-dependent reductase (Old Yellow Enzyme family)